MTNTVTISLSLGSGQKAQDLADKIKLWAGARPVSQVIRELIEREIASVLDIPEKQA